MPAPVLAVVVAVLELEVVVPVLELPPLPVAPTVPVPLTVDPQLATPRTPTQTAAAAPPRCR